jgi:hypothetical protein
MTPYGRIYGPAFLTGFSLTEVVKSPTPVLSYTSASSQHQSRDAVLSRLLNFMGCMVDVLPPEIFFRSSTPHHCPKELEKRVCPRSCSALYSILSSYRGVEGEICGRRKRRTDLECIPLHPFMRCENGYNRGLLAWWSFHQCCKFPIYL